MFTVMLSFLVVFSVATSCTDASCYGQQAVKDFNTLWGNPQDFVQGIENNIKVDIDNYMGIGVSAFCFGLVLKSLIR